MASELLHAASTAKKKSIDRKKMVRRLGGKTMGNYNFDFYNMLDFAMPFKEIQSRNTPRAALSPHGRLYWGNQGLSIQTE